MVVDSDSDEYEFVHNLLSLAPDFVSGIFVLSFIRKDREEKAVSFIDEVVRTFFDGSFPALISRYSHMPTTVELAQTARRQYLTQNGLHNLNPYKMDKPRDALRTISRHVEYEIFKDLQIKIRSIELIRIILGDDPTKVDIEKALRAIVLNFPKIDAMLLSAAQQRKSRAGYSFEHHIEMMMKDGEYRSISKLCWRLKSVPILSFRVRFFTKIPHVLIPKPLCLVQKRPCGNDGNRLAVKFETATSFSPPLMKISRRMRLEI